MQSRRNVRSKKYKHYTTIASIVLVLLIALGIGVGFKVHQDIQNQKVYAAMAKKAETAVQTAYKNPTEQNIKSAKDLFDKLKKGDKAELKNDVKSAEEALDHLNDVKTAITTYQTEKTDASYKAANAALDKLKSSYELKEKPALVKQLATVKTQVDAAKAKEEAEALANKYKGKKLVALTFDDGPYPETTPGLLKYLKSVNVNVTFFALGENAKANPDIIKQEAADGNVVASHTWDHKELTTLSPAAQKQEIMSAHNLIDSLTGKTVNIYRPPYGAYDKTTLAQTTLSPIIWGVDTEDWKLVGNSAAVAQNAITHAHNGAIILIHDIHPWSVAAVPTIVSTLQSQGYTFVTVPELLGALEGGIKPQTAYTGY